jgi:hypothetical protein
MKKSTHKRSPHKLVLRAEALVLLTPVQLGNVVGASQQRTCSIISNELVDCDTQIA